MGKQSKDKTDNKDTIYINDIDLEYLSTKTDKYNNEISYFKIINSLGKKKLKSIRDMEFYGFRMPYWSTDDNSIILKVNNKFITDNKLKQGNLYNTNIEFIAYSFDTDDGNFMQGMYCKTPKYKKLEITTSIKISDFLFNMILFIVCAHHTSSNHAF